MDNAQLTPHISQAEMGVLGCDVRLVANAQFLAEKILEPIRDHFEAPLRIHDGYRDPGHNSRVGGKPASFHLFDDGKAAADFDIQGQGLHGVFDWVRLSSELPFDKCILESNSEGIPACVHVQVDSLNPPRRQAFVGGTGASQSYTQVTVS